MEPFRLIGVCPLGWGAGWAVTRELGYIELSKAEGPLDTHWTVTIMGAD